MLDELQNRLAFLEKRLTVLEHEVSSLKAARQDASGRASASLPHYVPCDATGLLIANGYDLDPNDRGGKWRWVGNDGPIQFVLPFGLSENATARILLAGHPRVDLQSMRVYVNDKLVAHLLEPDAVDRQALLIPLEPSPQTVDIVLDRVKSISLKEIKEGEDVRPLAFKFFGMEIVARQRSRDSSASVAPEPEVVDPSIRFGEMRLDERLAGTDDYRHLDISVFDTRLLGRHWNRIKFKFANFKGDAYLEFRNQANWPETFRVWPGGDGDDASQLLKIPEPKTAAVPRFVDRSDLAMLEAVFENLELIVRTVTSVIDAPNEEIELWREEARALADRALKRLAVGQDSVEILAPPASPEAEPEPEDVGDSIRFGLLRLDERLPRTGEYRHLDISIFDARLRKDRWERIKFKFASFRGGNYLEFRSLADWPEVFRVWPGTEEDAISKLVKIPEPKTGLVPEFVDPRDRETIEALFGNLDSIVRMATTGMDAPNEEIELWRAEAQALADSTIPILTGKPRPFEPLAEPPSIEPASELEVVDDSIRFGSMSLDERLPRIGEYRHLDISIFDVRLKSDHWERIKFKFASFENRNYLEFREKPNRPRVFRVWPGTEEDGISKLLNIPEPKTEAVPEIRDPGDLEVLRALFENLERIVRTVTTGIDAPDEEIELWREEARALADRALRALPAP